MPGRGNQTQREHHGRVCADTVSTHCSHSSRGRSRRTSRSPAGVVGARRPSRALTRHLRAVRRRVRGRGLVDLRLRTAPRRLAGRCHARRPPRALAAVQARSAQGGRKQSPGSCLSSTTRSVAGSRASQRSTTTRTARSTTSATSSRRGQEVGFACRRDELMVLGKEHMNPRGPIHGVPRGSVPRACTRESLSAGRRRPCPRRPACLERRAHRHRDRRQAAGLGLAKATLVVVVRPGPQE